MKFTREKGSRWDEHGGPGKSAAGMEMAVSFILVTGERKALSRQRSLTEQGVPKLACLSSFFTRWLPAHWMTTAPLLYTGPPHPRPQFPSFPSPGSVRASPPDIPASMITHSLLLPRCLPLLLWAPGPAGTVARTPPSSSWAVRPFCLNLLIALSAWSPPFYPQSALSILRCVRTFGCQWLNPVKGVLVLIYDCCSIP